MPSPRTPPPVLIHRFQVPPTIVGSLLGVLLMLGGGLGMLIGGVVSGLVRSRGVRGGRIPAAVCSAVLTIPIILLLNSSNFHVALAATALYIFLSSAGEAAGMLAILACVPNTRHGLITSISFFLNVALGAGIGPVAVGILADHLQLAYAGIGRAVFLISRPAFVLVAALFNARTPQRATKPKRLRADGNQLRLILRHFVRAVVAIIDCPSAPVKATTQRLQAVDLRTCGQPTLVILSGASLSLGLDPAKREKSCAPNVTGSDASPQWSRFTPRASGYLSSR